jgi:hypothetical protein
MTSSLLGSRNSFEELSANVPVERSRHDEHHADTLVPRSCIVTGKTRHCCRQKNWLKNSLPWDGLKVLANEWAMEREKVNSVNNDVTPEARGGNPTKCAVTYQSTLIGDWKSRKNNCEPT